MFVQEKDFKQPKEGRQEEVDKIFYMVKMETCLFLTP